MSTEPELLRARHPWVVFVPPVIAIGAGVWIAREAHQSLWHYLGWLVSLAGGAWFIGRVVVASTNTLSLTATRLTARTGVLSLSTLDIALGSVESIETRRNLLGLLFNYGTVSVRGGGGSRTRVYLVGRPDAFRAAAMKVLTGAVSGNQDPSPLHGNTWLAGLWSKVAGAERGIAKIDRQWTSKGKGDVASAARRGIEALDEVERTYTLRIGEKTWLTNLREVMRSYIPRQPHS